MATDITLGYYEVRAYAQPIRLLLKYAGIKFVDKRYPFGQTDSDKDIDSLRKYWLKEKYTLGLDFPNLPYLIDGQIKLTQSLAILRYLARKYGLFAKEEPFIAYQDLVEQQLQDFKLDFVRLVLSDGFETAKNQWIENNLVPQLQSFSKYLSDKDWLIGQLNYVDFIAYELFQWLRLFDENTFQKFDNLNKFLVRFESLANISSYINSSEFLSWPLFGPIAKWGSSKSMH